MTIAVESNRVVATGNGVTTSWPFAFSCLDEATLEVYTYEISTGALTGPLSDSLYTVSGVPGSSGAVEYPLVGSPLASTHKIIIQRIVDLLQPSTFSNAAGFDPATLTLRLDDIVRQVQQVNDAVSRAVKVDVSGVDNPDDFMDDMDTAVAAAAASAAAAATAKTNAETAETNAETAMAAAQIAETNAETAETNAELAETNAAASAAAAAISAEAAENSIAAIPYAFSTTTADADPGAGTLRLNHATPASATEAYLDNVDADGVTVTGDLDTWDDSTTTASRGKLTLRALTNSAIKYVFNVTGSVVDGTGYRKLTLTYVSGSGTITNGMAVAVTFNRTGDKGTDGLGTGDVNGPASVTDDLPAVFDGTTGKLLKQKTYAAFKTLLALVKGDVGLGNVDNTSDANKPVSTAQQTALNLKANLASPTFTGTVTIPTGASITNPNMTGTIKEDVYVIVDAAGYVINPTDGSIQRWTLTASRTPGAAHADWTDGKSVTLLIADGTAYTITWSTLGVVWKGAVAPTLATTGYTEVIITKENGVLRGVIVGDFAS